MEKETAKKIILALEKLGSEMNDTASIIEEIIDEEEKRIFRRGIADLMAKSYTDIMHPIIFEYPDLDPDRDTEWFKNHQDKKNTKNYIQTKTKKGT